MNTETKDIKAANGWVLYDGECRICTGAVLRWGNALRRRGFECIPLQTPWVRERLNLSETELMLEMRVLPRTGNVIGGAAAVLVLARHFWWALPLLWLASVPGVFRLLDAAYRWGAARRYCANGACARRGDKAAFGVECGGLTPLSISPAQKPTGASAGHGIQSGVKPPHSKAGHWYVLLLPLCVPFLLRDVPPWVFMWAMAGAIWLALKLLTLLDVPRRPSGRSLAYLFAWPGLDATEFFSDLAVALPSRRDWFFATLNIACGAAFLFGAARAAYPYSALLAGWLAMIGTVMVLHFGLFKALGLFWRRCAIPATPLMDAPLRARSLSDFWGRRWNTGFSIPARRYLMEPIARKLGTTWGLSIVFLVSGLVHELVISLPAKAGYGLPTLYFLIQGAGLILERRHGANRLVTILCVAAPTFILFHPPFVHRVIIPFLKVIGAL